MDILESYEHKMFRYLVSLSQEKLKNSIEYFLKSQYDPEDVTIKDKYIIAKGDIPICLVAHMDTVFEKPPVNIFYDSKQFIYWSPEGLGVDDRAGIFAIFLCIVAGFHPTVIITEDEECGGLGAAMVEKEDIEINYFIELDRHGSQDCVFYEATNPQFEEFISSFGFDKAQGTFSDIYYICKTWGVCGTNLSIGYYNEHCYNEYLSVADLMKTVNKVQRMLSFDTIPKFVYKGGDDSNG